MKTNILIGVLGFLFSISVFAKQSVLFIGDSHSYGPQGTVIDSFYRSKGYAVSSYASCGSSPSTWVRTTSNFKSTNCGFWNKNPAGKETRVNNHRIPSFSEAMSKSDPDMTVISLGTNMLSSPAGIKSELKHIETMVKAIKDKGSECIWIGPPDLRKNPFKANLASGVTQIKSLVEKYECKFIDSSKFMKYSGGDGIHYGPRDSKAWGESVSKQLTVPKETSASSSSGTSRGSSNSINTSGTR